MQSSDILNRAQWLESYASCFGHIKNKNYPYSIIRDREFHHSKQILEGKARQLWAIPFHKLSTYWPKRTTGTPHNGSRRFRVWGRRQRHRVCQLALQGKSFQNPARTTEIIGSDCSSNLQDLVNYVDNWTKNNNMKLNVGKCKELIIDFAKKGHHFPSLTVDDVNIKRVKSTCILGLTIQNNMK